MEILCRMADTDFKDRGAKLPIPLELWMDEFYAGARPHETETLMGVVRSRNISLIPILQSVSQIKALFRSEKWEIIMDNTPVMLFLGAGSGALETHKYISELRSVRMNEEDPDGGYIHRISVCTDPRSGEQYTHGGGENVIQSILTNELVMGMLCYSGGAACGKPVIHMGPVGVNGNVEPHNCMDNYKDYFRIYGKRFAKKALELFA